VSEGGCGSESESNRLLLIRVRFGSAFFSKTKFEFGSVRIHFLKASSGSVRFECISEKSVRVRFGSTAFSKSRFEFGSVHFRSLIRIVRCPV
jgi:hypothetical protein